MNSNVYVAFLDVLGFRDLVCNNSHEALVRKYQKLLLPITELSLSNGAFNVIKQDGRQLAIADTTRMTINSLVISDSVILWTQDATRESFVGILIATKNMLVQGMLCGMPIRGGIAIGPLSRLSYSLNSQMDNSVGTFVGKGLVDAYLTESSQQWSGCVVNDSAVAEYDRQRSEKHNNLNSVRHAGLIVEYDVPVCNATTERHWVINWPRGNKTPLTENTVRKSFGKHNKSVDSPSVKLKIDNTVRFLHAMVS